MFKCRNCQQFLYWNFSDTFLLALFVPLMANFVVVTVLCCFLNVYRIGIVHESSCWCCCWKALFSHDLIVFWYLCMIFFVCDDRCMYQAQTHTRALVVLAQPIEVNEVRAQLSWYILIQILVCTIAERHYKVKWLTWFPILCVNVWTVCRSMGSCLVFVKARM